jgi:hypothetical protein
MARSRYGMPILCLAIFLLALTGLHAKLIPLDAVSLIQLRGVIATLTLALFGLLLSVQKRPAGLGAVSGGGYVPGWSQAPCQHNLGDDSSQQRQGGPRCGLHMVTD